jgi:hypothetical protein
VHFCSGLFSGRIPHSSLPALNPNRNSVFRFFVTIHNFTIFKQSWRTVKEDSLMAGVVLFILEFSGVSCILPRPILAPGGCLRLLLVHGGKRLAGL